MTGSSFPPVLVVDGTSTAVGLALPDGPGGKVTGFFAVSYTIMVFPIALIFLPRL